MADPEPMSAAPEPSVAAFSDAETIDLIESWLRAEPELRFGKARAQGQSLRLEVTRRQFGEAKRRIGITATAAPQPDHRRSVRVRRVEPDAVVAAEPPAVVVPASPKAGRRSSQRRRRRPVNLAGLSNLAESLQAIVEKRDRARAALDEIRRILKGLH